MMIDYILEREDAIYVQDKNGFFLYNIFPNQIFIQSMFVKPTSRGKKTSFYYADICKAIARGLGKRYLTCSSCPEAVNFDHADWIINSYGFNFVGHENGVKKYIIDLQGE